MNLMSHDGQEWDRFIKFVWRYQYTVNKVNLTTEMEGEFFEESVGNPFVASMLYKLVQDDAIISKKEKFSVADVKRVANEKMGITAKMRRDMLAGVDVELNAYCHLWDAADILGKMPTLEKNKAGDKADAEDGYNAIVAEIAARLEKSGIPMNDARSYARQAIAAYPNDQNMDVLFGYAIALYNATIKE